MASQPLTEYERRRLEYIKRNGEKMASLNLHAKANELSFATKRHRIENKGYKATPEKKPKSQTPIVIRRSLRARGVPPDSSTAKGIRFPVKARKPYTPQPSRRKLAPLTLSMIDLYRTLGPLSMRYLYCNRFSDRHFIDTIKGMSENAPLSCSIKSELDGDGGSLDLGSLILKPENIAHTIKGMSENAPLSCSIKSELDGDGGSLDLGSLILKPENIARVMPGRIMDVKFLPSTDRTIIVAGNNFGVIAFWDFNCKEGEEEEDGIYLYHPHTVHISGISIQPFSLSKVFTSCYDGFICLMDVEKELFDLIYSSDNAIFSLSQRPHDVKSLYFGEARGGLNVWDDRAGKSSSSWKLHDEGINTIDFSPENTNFMATSSIDGTACIWDLRSMDADRPKTLKTVDHKTAVHSAYFSPSGKSLATTSVNDKVGVLSGIDFMDTSMISHPTRRWISSFRAIWGWDDSYLFIGNMARGVEVISTIGRKMVTLESTHMSAVPCCFAAHPYKVGILAGATSEGEVYTWTSR